MMVNLFKNYRRDILSYQRAIEAACNIALGRLANVSRSYEHNLRRYYKTIITDIHRAASQVNNPLDVKSVLIPLLNLAEYQSSEKLTYIELCYVGFSLNVQNKVELIKSTCLNPPGNYDSVVDLILELSNSDDFYICWNASGGRIKMPIESRYLHQAVKDMI